MRRRSVFIAATGLCIAGLAITVVLVTHKPSGLLFVSEIPNVHDGDTIYYQERSFCLPTQGVRLLGIDTPELAETGGHNAQDAFQDIVDECDGRFWIDAPEEVQDDPNRRLVAILLVNQRDQVSVNEQLVLDGWAHIYRMQDSSDKLQDLEQRLLEAQIEAALNRRGSWAESGDVVVAAIQYWTDPEQVVLVNRGEESVPVEDWYLLDPEPESLGSSLGSLWGLTFILRISRLRGQVQQSSTRNWRICLLVAPQMKKGTGTVSLWTVRWKRSQSLREAVREIVWERCAFLGEMLRISLRCWSRC